MGEASSTLQSWRKEDYQRTWASTTKLDFSKKEMTLLTRSVLQERKTKHGQKIKPKILVFGPTGMGKSSLCNGFISALEGTKYVSTYNAVGSTSGNFTKGFQAKDCGSNWIIDMGGIFETGDIKNINIANIASGKVPFYRQMVNDLLEPSAQMKMPAAGENDVSCVVIVLAIGNEVPTQIKRMLNVIMDLAGQGVVAYHLVLTHPDLCDDRFRDVRNLKHIYDSPEIQKGVMGMAEQTGVPPTNISVVRNYANERDTDLHSNILLLSALDKIVHVAAEQNQKREDMEKMRQMYR